MTYPPFRHRQGPCPVRDPFVHGGSALPALATVVASDRCFRRAVDDDDDGSPSQSISDINRVMTSSSCLLSMLISVVFVIILLLPKRPSQSLRRTTSKKLHAYSPASMSALSSSSVATPLPSLPSQSSCPMNNVGKRGGEATARQLSDMVPAQAS